MVSSGVPVVELAWPPGTAAVISEVAANWPALHAASRAVGSANAAATAGTTRRRRCERVTALLLARQRGQGTTRYSVVAMIPGPAGARPVATTGTPGSARHAPRFSVPCRG